jgi:hypothetical protein
VCGSKGRAALNVVGHELIEKQVMHVPSFASPMAGVFPARNNATFCRIENPSGLTPLLISRLQIRNRS